MRITLLGATVKTGTELVKAALAEGDTITALVRSPNKITITNANLNVVTGKVTSVKDLTKAFTGAEVVINTLGSMKDISLMTDTVKALITATKQTGVKRVILLSSMAVKRDQLNLITKLATKLLMKKPIADKSASEQLLRNSDLQWTIVYGTALKDNATQGNVRIVSSDEKLGFNNTITRADVAAWILVEAKTNAYVRKEPILTQ